MKVSFLLLFLNERMDDGNRIKILHCMNFKASALNTQHQ